MFLEDGPCGGVPHLEQHRDEEVDLTGAQPEVIRAI